MKSKLIIVAILIVSTLCLSHLKEEKAGAFSDPKAVDSQNILSPE